MSGDLRHLGAGHRGDHLGAVLGDAARFVVAADDEADDVLQEQQRHTALAAQLDEMRGFQRAFREQDAVVAQNADRDAVNVGEAGDQRGAVERLELVEFGAVDQPRDHLAHVVLLFQIDRYDAVELAGVVFRLGAVWRAGYRSTSWCSGRRRSGGTAQAHGDRSRPYSRQRRIFWCAPRRRRALRR